MTCRILLACWAVLGVIGCGGDGTPRIRYGDESCAYCRMIINDDRFAAAVTLASGETLKFDDIGCLVDHLASQTDAVARRWVCGYESSQWLDADAAFFVYGPNLQTPMATGVAAIATKDKADALAREWDGRTSRFAELPGLINRTNGLRSNQTPESILPSTHANGATP